MTMPYGSAEEYDGTILTEDSPLAFHVVSTGRGSGASEFGRWRTILVNNTVGQNSVTPGAQRLCNRSLRRKRLLIKVNAANGSTSQTDFAGSNPAAGASFVYTNTSGVSQSLLAIRGTLTTDVTVANRFQQVVIKDAGGNTLYSVIDSSAQVASTTLTLNGYIGATQQNSAAGTWTAPLSPSVTIPPGGTVTLQGQSGAADQWSAIQLTLSTATQSSLDGVIVGGREEIISGQPAIPGLLGGYLQIGDNVRWEVQAELWVCYPQTNVGSVYVTISDEQYASDPATWKSGGNDDS